MVLRRDRLKPGLQNGEATDRLEHWLLNASRSLDSILKDAAAAALPTSPDPDPRSLHESHCVALCEAGCRGHSARRVFGI